MPRELKAWRGKEPPAQREDVARVEQAPQQATPSTASAEPTRPTSESRSGRAPGNRATPCPGCGRRKLRELASGALGCLFCGAVFSLQQEAPVDAPEAAEEEVGALDTMDAINEMLRRNELTLGPGGVPLAEPRSQAVAAPEPRRGRPRNRRRVRR